MGEDEIVRLFNVKIKLERKQYKKRVLQLEDVMSYGMVYIVTKDYEFVDAFETEEEAEWYKDAKATEALQRALEELGINDPTEKDIEDASIQAGFDRDCYEIECIDISGLSEEEEIYLADGDNLEVREILDALKKQKNSQEDKSLEEDIDDYLLRNVKGYMNN